MNHKKELLRSLWVVTNAGAFLNSSSDYQNRRLGLGLLIVSIVCISFLELDYRILIIRFG